MSEEVERYDPDYQWEFMEEIAGGEYVKYSDYEKLLAKYNGVFEWAKDVFEVTWYTEEEIKREYEESLKDAK